VEAYVRSVSSEAKFLVSVQGAWTKLMSRGLATDSKGWEHAITCVTSVAECVHDADYVQESVVEDLEAKQRIIEEIDQFAPEHVIVGSSSSFIPLSLLRARAKRFPGRCATVHPTLPQWDDFVEILGATSEYAQWLATFLGKENLGMDTIILRREMHGHAHNCVLNVIAVTACALVKGGFTSAEELDRALVHLARLIIASGGISGALVGFVGNGSVDAQSSLSADIAMNSPATMGACVLSFVLPSRLATIFHYIWTAIFSMFARSVRVKRWIKRCVEWFCADFYEEWHQGAGATRFEERALRRLVRLSCIDT